MGWRRIEEAWRSVLQSLAVMLASISVIFPVYNNSILTVAFANVTGTRLRYLEASVSKLVYSKWKETLLLCRNKCMMQRPNYSKIWIFKVKEFITPISEVRIGIKFRETKDWFYIGLSWNNSYTFGWIIYCNRLAVFVNLFFLHQPHGNRSFVMFIY